MSEWLNGDQKEKLTNFYDSTVLFLESMGQKLTEKQKTQLKEGLFKESDIQLMADGGACVKSIGPMFLEIDTGGCKGK